MRENTGEQPARALRTFCDDATRQVHRLETRLRTIVAGAEPEAGLRLFEETVRSSLELAKVLLDAGQRGQHATLLAHRPLLRALSTQRR
jgi:hypothetical protein